MSNDDDIKVIDAFEPGDGDSWGTDENGVTRLSLHNEIVDDIDEDGDSTVDDIADSEFNEVAHSDVTGVVDVDQLVDDGYHVFEPTARISKDFIDEEVRKRNVVYAMVLTHTNPDFKPLIVGTVEAFKNHRPDITILKNICQSHRILLPQRAYASAEQIKRHLLNLEIQDEDEEDIAVAASELTDAKLAFNQIIAQGLKKGASDFNIVYSSLNSYYAFSIDGMMGPKEVLTGSDAKAMVNAMFNTESENMTGSLEDDQIIDKNLNVEVTYEDDDGKRRREQVRLRAEKVAAHGGYTLSCRIIKTNQSLDLKLSDLGFEDDQYELLQYLKDLPTGIVLIVGPTGHGKSVTLKAFYEAMNPSWKMVVIEDPVEYIINHPHVTQESVVPEKGLTLARYIKSSLRQFPKVIGVSEIREGEVADLVINISLSGHKMVATMHANDCVAVLPRLRSIGVSYEKQAQDGLFTASMSQRLLPLLCDSCKKPFKHPEFGDVFERKRGGCDVCDNKGVKGRKLVGEILVFDSTIRELLKNDRLNDIKPYLKSRGWRSMADRGVSLIKAGKVSPHDLFQALGDSTDSDVSEFSYIDGRYTSNSKVAS